MPLKLVASVSKKVPGEVEYSSKSYLASLEVELATGLTSEQLNAEIHKTYAQLEKAVDEQINNQTHHQAQPPRSQQRASQGPSQPSETKATNKQIQFILSLGKNQQKGLPDLNAMADEQFHAPTIYDLTKRDASRMVDVLKQAA